MDETAHQTWWRLHLRSTRGETLEPEEQATYERGLGELHETEHIAGDTASLRDRRVEVARLRADNAELSARRQQLDQEIAALEEVLSLGTKQALGVEG